MAICCGSRGGGLRGRVGQLPGCEHAAAKKAPDKDTAGVSVQYLPLDASAGTSQAVIVQANRWCTRGSCCRWIAKESPWATVRSTSRSSKSLNNLDAVLGASGSGLGKLVR